MVERYVAAWNTHDANALGDFFTRDADMIMGTGPILSPLPAFLDWWRGYFALQEPARTLTIDIQAMRAITADVAILSVRTTTGGRTAQGTELISRRARGTWVMLKQGDRWRISAMRGMPTEQDHIIRSHDQP